MRISDWSSECALPICEIHGLDHRREVEPPGIEPRDDRVEPTAALVPAKAAQILAAVEQYVVKPHEGGKRGEHPGRHLLAPEPLLERSEEHTSELQSLMRISYAVFCLKKKKKQSIKPETSNT